MQKLPNISRFGFNIIWDSGFCSYSTNIYLICFVIYEVWGCVVMLSQNDVGKLLLMLSCANRKFDNLMLSANFKFLDLLYKGLTDGPGVESPGFKK